MLMVDRLTSINYWKNECTKLPKKSDYKKQDRNVFPYILAGIRGGSNIYQTRLEKLVPEEAIVGLRLEGQPKNVGKRNIAVVRTISHIGFPFAGLSVWDCKFLVKSKP